MLKMAHQLTLSIPSEQRQSYISPKHQMLVPTLPMPHVEDFTGLACPECPRDSLDHLCYQGSSPHKAYNISWKVRVVGLLWWSQCWQCWNEFDTSISNLFPSANIPCNTLGGKLHPYTCNHKAGSWHQSCQQKVATTLGTQLPMNLAQIVAVPNLPKQQVSNAGLCTGYPRQYGPTHCPGSTRNQICLYGLWKSVGHFYLSLFVKIAVQLWSKSLHILLHL